MSQNPSLQVLASAHLPVTGAPSVSLPHNDLDYSAAEYGHLAGLPAARTLQLPSPEQELSHAEAMTLALQAARQGIRGANPLVGAVITDAHGHLLHVGYHRGAGTPHAEADALAAARAAGTDLTGARMYVSLEPCNHTGRTGPCSHAVAEAGIGELYYAYSDDTENAAGGAAYLRSQGVTVHAMEEFANASYLLNERWFIAAAERRPFITAKSASTLDGFIAAADGTSKWITGPAARIDGHLIRHRADAVMIGTRTTLMDDPTLDARDANGERFEKQPLRVVMGKTEITENYRVRGLNPPEGVEADPQNFLQVFTHDPRELLDELYARGVRHLMIEGGPGMVGLFAGEDLIDEMVWYRAPMIMGQGKSAVYRLLVDTLAQAPRLQLDDLGMFPAVRVLGNDTATHLVPAPRGTAQEPGERRTLPKRRLPRARTEIRLAEAGLVAAGLASAWASIPWAERGRGSRTSRSPRLRPANSCLLVRMLAQKLPVTGNIRKIRIVIPTNKPSPPVALNDDAPADTARKGKHTCLPESLAPSAP